MLAKERVEPLHILGAKVDESSGMFEFWHIPESNVHCGGAICGVQIDAMMEGYSCIFFAVDEVDSLTVRRKGRPCIDWRGFPDAVPGQEPSPQHATGYN